jgi:hypothetical protein
VPSPGQSKLQVAGSSKKKKGKGKDSGASSDEERWLDAIESGKLEEVSSLHRSAYQLYGESYYFSLQKEYIFGCYLLNKNSRLMMS